MKPMPEELGEDLNEIKTLIEERTTQRAVHQSNILAEQKAMDAIDKEIRELRNHASIKLGVKADRSKGKTPKTADKPPKKEKKDATPPDTPAQ